MGVDGGGAGDGDLTDAGLDDLAAALPAVLDAPGPYTPPPGKPALGDWADNWVREPAEGFELDEETSPEAIAADQRRDVAAYLKGHPGATAADVSAAVVLPVWTVKRRMKELAGGG